MSPASAAASTDIAAAVPFDAARAEAFANRIVGALNDGALAVMLSIGHRTGLFDAMADAGPLSSRALAERAALDERYVREWLAVMVTGRVVDYAPEAGTYLLPAEHGASLTRAASPGNLAVTAQNIGFIGHVETPLVECFRRGGGLGYDSYHRFHEIMAEESSQTVLGALDEILALVPDLVARLEAGIAVADVGCGQARALLALAELFPRSRFTGYDLCEDPVASARGEAARRGLANIAFEVRDLAARPIEGPFGLVTGFDAIHDQKDPQGLLDTIAAALSPDGVFLAQDIGGSSRLERNLDHPLGPFLYAISTAHCMSVSLAQGGPGLGTMWGTELAQEMFGRAGFCSVEQHALPHDPVNVFYVARKA